MPASALPAAVAAMRIGTMGRPMARAASALSPTMRKVRPARVVRKAQARRKARAMPRKKRGLTSSALRT